MHLRREPEERAPTLPSTASGQAAATDSKRQQRRAEAFQVVGQLGGTQGADPVVGRMGDLARVTSRARARGEAASRRTCGLLDPRRRSRELRS